MKEASTPPKVGIIPLKEAINPLNEVIIPLKQDSTLPKTQNNV